MGASGWIGVDLDGTLARYDGWTGQYSIGAPVPRMVERVREWLQQGVEVRIFTARVSTGLRNLDGSEFDLEGIRKAIEDWCERHVGQRLPVTCQKDYAMLELWDDRAVQVIPNTGERVVPE